MIKNKTGNAILWFDSITFLFAFGFMNILGYSLMFFTVQAFSATPFWDSTMQEVGNKFLFALSFLDWILVFMTLIFIVVVAVSSYRINSPPIYFILNFVMAAFYGYISYIFNYMFQTMVSYTYFNTFISTFTRTHIILTNLHWVMLAMIIVSAITAYSKRDRSSYVGGF